MDAHDTHAQPGPRSEPATDQEWVAWFTAEAAQLDEVADGQLAMWPVDDLLGRKRYVPCPQRGWHQRLTECWMRFCDVTWGHATADEVLGRGEL